MSTDATLFQDDQTIDEVQQYRTLSKMAVAAAVLANLSLLAVLFIPLVALPLFATLVAAIAVVLTRRNADSVTGQRLALAALIEAPVIFLLAVGLHVHSYITEVPENYERISFYELNPHPGRPANPVPESARVLNGKRVFVKGYMHPGVQGFGEIKHFVLVPDMKTCCFGGQPKPWDMIEVHVREPNGPVRYSRRPRKISGVLTINEEQRDLPGDIIGGFYELEADIVQ